MCLKCFKWRGPQLIGDVIGDAPQIYSFNLIGSMLWEDMPRKARIDAPGALHHIMARGIERRDIFEDDFDRNNFLERIEKIILETDTRCYAWALIPNHFHLLLKTGRVPIATVMRRLLTGHAGFFNRRHRRHGHLFQNRYKSILCQEDVYLKELVRYIHLNPRRSGLVDALKDLDKYPFCGHSAIMGRKSRKWQNIAGVLDLFSDTVFLARKYYRSFVKKGIDQGHREDLIGGGLIRSSGGWSSVKAMRKAKIYEKSDERILGDGEFVENVLSTCQEQLERKYTLINSGVTTDEIAVIAAKLVNTEPELIFKPGKERDRVRARSLFCYWSAKELGVPMTDLSRLLKISLSAISLSVKRGEKICVSNDYSITDLLKLQN